MKYFLLLLKKGDIPLGKEQDDKDSHTLQIKGGVRGCGLRAYSVGQGCSEEVQKITSVHSQQLS